MADRVVQVGAGGLSEVTARAPFAWVFGAQSVGSTTAARFLPLGYFAGSAPTTELDHDVGLALAVTAIRLRVRVAGMAGGNLVGALRKNGAVAAALTTVSTALTGAAVVAATFAPGDLVGFQVTKSAGFTSGTDVLYTVTGYYL